MRMRASALRSHTLPDGNEDLPDGNEDQPDGNEDQLSSDEPGSSQPLLPIAADHALG
ncbi:MAG: hypothetical protein H6718_24070 [Polyangiaceae bacterium]|nr:hypothetical protein [Polyangiaceae bacterium]